MSEVAVKGVDDVTPPVRMNEDGGGAPTPEAENQPQAPEGSDPPVAPQDNSAAPPNEGVWVGKSWYPSQEAANEAHLALRIENGRQSNEIGTLRNQNPAQSEMDKLGPEPELDTLDPESVKEYMAWNSQKAVLAERERVQVSNTQQQQVNAVTETNLFLDQNPNLSVSAVRAVEQIRRSKNISYDAAHVEYKAQLKQANDPVKGKQDVAAAADPTLSGGTGGGGGAVVNPDKMDKAELTEWLRTAPEAEKRKYYGG